MKSYLIYFNLVFGFYWVIRVLQMSLFLHLCLNLHIFLFVLQALDWNLCPETPISWLKLYAQVEAQQENSGEENFLVPQFSQEKYIQIAQVSGQEWRKNKKVPQSKPRHWLSCVLLQLLDLCMMDVNYLDFSYSVLAASAFCHFHTFDVVHKVSGEFRSCCVGAKSHERCGRIEATWS